jgi:hypothetical protein
MGSSISAIYDDYDDYKSLCESFGIETKGIYSGFYEHQREILNNLGFKSIYDYWEDNKKKDKRNKQIDEILK